MAERGEASEEVLGRHLIADMTGLSPALLRDGDRIMRVLKEALDQAGFHALKSVEHQFVERGEGFTGVVLLEESHAAVHTYPELEYLALDIFACGRFEPADVMDALVRDLGPANVDVRTLTRTPRVTIPADKDS
jgi:S-adenosylmethionine decarboxylase